MEKEDIVTTDEMFDSSCETKTSRTSIYSETSEAYVFSIKSVVQTLKDHARFIMIMFMLFFMASVCGALLFNLITRTHTGYASALILFGFPEAEEGFDPLGNPLDVNMIRSPYVIGKALDQLDMRELGITADGVRSNLRIQHVVPHDTLDRILLIRESAIRLPERLMELEEVFYHPTQYVLRLYRGEELATLDDQNMIDLLNEIAHQYRIYFVETYSEFQFMDVVIRHFDQTGYDYFEVVRILQHTINNMLSYVSALRDTAPDFRSPSTQMRFGDIRASLDMIRTVQVERVSALVYINNMSRNRDRAANLIEYDIIRMQMEYTVAQAYADDALFLVDEVYEHEHWVFHHTGEAFIYRHATGVHDDLIRAVLRHRAIANQLAVDIEFYQGRVEALRAAQDPANPQDVQYVEETIQLIFTSLQEWEDIINETMEDFLTLELFRDAVRLVSPAGFRSAFLAYRQQVILIVLVGSLAGLFLGVLIALCRDATSDKKRYNVQS